MPVFAKAIVLKRTPAILGQRNCLQYWSSPRQSLHIAPISTILCWYNHQAHILGSARHRRGIRIVDLPGQHLRLHTDCVLLGKEYTWRPLSKFTGSLVLKCFVQYRYRFHNLHLTNTGTQGSSITKEAEIHSDRCLCAGWIVSRAPFHSSAGVMLICAVDVSHQSSVCTRSTSFLGRTT